MSFPQDLTLKGRPLVKIKIQLPLPFAIGNFTPSCLFTFASRRKRSSRSNVKNPSQLYLGAVAKDIVEVHISHSPFLAAKIVDTSQ